MTLIWENLEIMTEWMLPCNDNNTFLHYFNQEKTTSLAWL